MLDATYSAYDVIEIAIEMEKNGAALYHELGSDTKNLPIAAIFKKLEDEKQIHIREYEALLKKVSKEAPAEAYPGEYLLYLKNLADEHALNTEELQKQLVDINTPNQALDIAVNFKKSSLLFLKELEQHVSKADDKVVKELLKKKQADLNHLLALKKKIK